MFQERNKNPRMNSKNVTPGKYFANQPRFKNIGSKTLIIAPRLATPRSNKKKTTNVTELSFN